VEVQRNTYRILVEKNAENTTCVNTDIDGKAYTGFVWLWIWTSGGL
jgi:hypothetical protein